MLNSTKFSNTNVYVLFMWTLNCEVHCKMPVIWLILPVNVPIIWRASRKTTLTTMMTTTASPPATQLRKTLVLALHFHSITSDGSKEKQNENDKIVLGMASRHFIVCYSICLFYFSPFFFAYFSPTLLSFYRSRSLTRSRWVCFNSCFIIVL